MAVLRIARDGVADRQQVRADLVGAAGLQPHAQQRERGQRLGDLEVRHRRPRVVGVRRVPRADAPVAAERGVDRARSARAGAPRPARRTRGRCRAPAAPPAARAARRRSWRRRAGRSCRGPGGARRPGASRSPPGALPASACTSVPLSCPRGGVHDDARRACPRRAGARPPRRPRAARAGRRRAPSAHGRRCRRRRATSPPRTLWPLRAGVPSTSTWPAAIRRCARVRDPRCPASSASSRSPSCSGATLRRTAALHDPQQQQDARA